MIRTHPIKKGRQCEFCLSPAELITQNEDHDGELLSNDAFSYHCAEHSDKARQNVIGRSK